MNKFLIAVVIALSVNIAAVGEDKDQMISAPAFTSGTDFVEVPVVVQKSGKHVSGLKKEDFVLRQDGKDQPIAFFQEVLLSTERGQKPEQQSFSPAEQIPPQMIVIALDMVNTPNLDRAYFTEQFQRYLSKAGKFSTPIALAAIERSGIHILREFTTDPRLLLSAITKDSSTQPMPSNNGPSLSRQLSDEAVSASESYGGNDIISVADALRLRSADEAMNRFQDRSSRIDTEYAIQQLAQALKGIPGRKSVLLVGSGFKFIDSNIVLKSIARGYGGVDLQYSQENAGQTLNQTAYTWKLLNDANIAVYPIDTRRIRKYCFSDDGHFGRQYPEPALV